MSQWRGGLAPNLSRYADDKYCREIKRSLSTVFCLRMCCALRSDVNGKYCPSQWLSDTVLVRGSMWNTEDWSYLVCGSMSDDRVHYCTVRFLVNSNVLIRRTPEKVKTRSYLQERFAFTKEKKIICWGFIDMIIRKPTWIPFVLPVSLQYYREISPKRLTHGFNVSFTDVLLCISFFTLNYPKMRVKWSKSFVWRNW